MARRTPWLAAATILLFTTAACSEPDRAFCPGVLYGEAIIIDDVDDVLRPSLTVGGTVCSGDLCADVRPTPVVGEHFAVFYELPGGGADTDQIQYDLIAYDDANDVIRKMTGSSVLSSAYFEGEPCPRPRTSTIRP